MELEHVLDTYNFTIPYDDFKIIVHRFTRMVTDGGLFAPVHMHNDYEFHYVISGRARVVIENAELEVKAGDVYFTKPYVNHEEYSIESDPVALYCIECQIEFPENVKSKIDRYETAAMKQILETVYYQSFRDNGDILNILNNIWEENRKRTLGYFFRSKIMIIECIAKTLQIVIGADGNEKTKLHDRHKDTRASSIKNYIDVNIANNVGMYGICNYIFLSEKQVNRIFFEKFNVTVAQYITDSKFELSKVLLKTTNDNLETVALKSGFTSYQQMYRVYERKINISPKKYREENSERF